MRTLVLLLIFPVFVFCLSGTASLQDSDKELLQILKRLDDPDPSTRDSASKALEARVLGEEESIRKDLDSHARTGSAELRGRIQAALNLLSRVTEARRILAIFDKLGLPDVTGKEFVIYNAGSPKVKGDRAEFRYVSGWLLDQSDSSIRLARSTLSIHQWDRDRSLPEEWQKHKDNHPKDRPLPGEFLVVDFATFCVDLEEGRWPAEGSLASAWYAHHALGHGLQKTAVGLLAMAEHEIRKDKEEKRPIGKVLVETAAFYLRTEAIEMATGGTARDKLLKTWTKLLSLPKNDLTAEAREMTAHYQTLIAEDEKWVEPGEEKLKRMKPSEKVAHWMHVLRDLDVRQMSQPGDCYVVSPLRKYLGSGSLNAAEELVSLGWESLPLVIEKLDDRRPTRCFRFHRFWSAESFYLLRYGDCCEQIFEAITGMDLYDGPTTSSNMISDGKGPEVKAAALKWWKEDGALGFVGYLLKSLNSPERGTFAAEKLMEMDRKLHLPAVLNVLKTGTRDQRNAVLLGAGDHLGKGQECILESFLEDEDFDVVIAAARALAERCGSDKGALKIVETMKGLTKADRSWLFFNGSSAFYAMREAATPEVRRGICALLNSPTKQVRKPALEEAKHFPFRDVAEALVAILDDTAESGWTSSAGRMRWCDLASDSLIEILIVRGKLGPLKGGVGRNMSVSQIKQWWGKNRDTVDWESKIDGSK